ITNSRRGCIMIHQGQGRGPKAGKRGTQTRKAGRWPGMAALLLGLARLTPVLAQGASSGQTPESYLNGLATLDSRYQPSGASGTGEAIDLYTGSLGFVVT